MRQCRFQNNRFVYSYYTHSGKITANVSYPTGSLVLSRWQALYILFYFTPGPPYDFKHYLMYLSPQTPPQFFLELEQARTYVASSLIAVCFFCMCGFLKIFYYSIINLRWGPYDWDDGWGSCAVSQWVSLLRSWMPMSNVFFIHITHAVFLFSQIHCLILLFF